MFFNRQKKMRKLGWTAIILYPLAFIKGIILGRIWARRGEQRG